MYTPLQICYAIVVCQLLILHLIIIGDIHVNTFPLGQIKHWFLLHVLLPRQEINTIISLYLGQFAAGQTHAPSALRVYHFPQPLGSRCPLVRGIYIFRNWLFLAYLFYHLLKFLSHFMHSFLLFLLNFFLNINFGWIVSLPKWQGICKNTYPWLWSTRQIQIEVTCPRTQTCWLLQGSNSHNWLLVLHFSTRTPVLSQCNTVLHIFI